MEVGNELKRIREASGLSQAKLAALAVVGVEAWKKWEGRGSAPLGENATKLCAFFKIDDLEDLPSIIRVYRNGDIEHDPLYPKKQVQYAAPELVGGGGVFADLARAAIKSADAATKSADNCARLADNSDKVVAMLQRAIVRIEGVQAGDQQTMQAMQVFLFRHLALLEKKPEARIAEEWADTLKEYVALQDRQRLAKKQ